MHLSSGDKNLHLIAMQMKLLKNSLIDNLETSLKGSDFISDSVQLMYYKCHNVNFKRNGSYIDSPDSIKK